MKKIIALGLTLVMVLSLAACGSKLASGDLIGIWSGSWEYDGKDINCSIEFDRDGTYANVVYQNNSVASKEKGTYTIDGNKVILYENGNKGISTTYQYKNGKLTNNGHNLSKE